jgi:hypothetical protein
MNISDMYNASQANVVMAQAYSRQLSNSTPSASAQETSKTQKALDSIEIRKQQKVESTQEQISSLGKLKASYAETQTAARDVQKLKSNASSTDLAAAADKLVNAYNTTLKAATNSESKVGNNVDAINTRRSSNELRRNVTSEGLSTNLQKAGVSINQDGTLKIDAEKFKAAAANDSVGLRKELEKVAQKVEASSTKALSDKGELNTSINNLKASVAKSPSTTTDNGTSSSNNTIASSKKTDRSAETRKFEQEKFEAELNKKYQNNSKPPATQQLAVTA